MSPFAIHRTARQSLALAIALGLAVAASSPGNALAAADRCVYNAKNGTCNTNQTFCIKCPNPGSQDAGYSNCGPVVFEGKLPDGGTCEWQVSLPADGDKCGTCPAGGKEVGTGTESVTAPDGGICAPGESDCVVNIDVGTAAAPAMPGFAVAGLAAIVGVAGLEMMRRRRHA